MNCGDRTESEERIGMRLGITDALRAMMTLAGKSMARVGKELDPSKKANNYTTMIARGSVKMGTGAKMAEICGYRLMLVPEEEVEKVTNGIVIDGGDAE